MNYFSFQVWNYFNALKYFFSSTHRFSFPLQVPVFELFDLGLEALRLPGVFGQHVHQVGDVTGRQAERLDFGQFGVGGHVGDALPQLRERAVDALRPAALLLRPGGSSLAGQHTPAARSLESLQPRVVRGPGSTDSGSVQLHSRVRGGGGGGGLDVEVRRDLSAVQHPALEVRPVLVAPLDEGEGLVHEVVVVVVVVIAPDQVHAERVRDVPGPRSD